MFLRKKELQPRVINPVFTDADLSENSTFSRLSFFFINDFFDWWFVRMPLIYAAKSRRLSLVLSDRLSIKLLSSTFFVPWHKDAKLVGYFMGITLRILYLPIACIAYLAIMIVYIIFMILWILLPLLTIIFMVLTPILA